MTLLLSARDHKNIRSLFARHKAGYELEGSVIQTRERISREQFQNALTRFTDLFGTYVERPEVLDVSYNSVRCSLEGMDRITAFCTTNELPPDAAFIQKKLIQEPPLDLHDYRIRLRLSSEDPILDSLQASNVLNSFRRGTKMYRLKKRYSFDIQGRYRADFTVIKQASGIKLQTVKLVDRYEVELEFVGGSIMEDVDQEVRVFLDWMAELVKALNHEFVLLSNDEKQRVRDEYLDLAHPVSEAGESIQRRQELLARDPGRLFLGPKLVTLERQHLLPKQHSPLSILGRYTVTDKADGERVLVFVSAQRQVYVINSALHVRTTGLVLAPEAGAPSIYDAELVHCPNEEGQYFHKILVFDAYYVGGACVAGLPLVAIGPREAQSIVDRYGHVQQLASHCPRLPHACLLAKTILRYDDAAGMAHCVKHMLSLRASTDYETDGLIFTPADAPVGATNASALSDYNLSNTTWELVLKWKPPNQNTIDFQVHFRKVPQKQLDFVDVDDQGRRFKLLDLYVGSNRCTPKDVIEGRRAALKWREQRFEPAPTARVYLDGNSDDVCCRDSGDIVLDGHIVEMAYDAQANNWLPMRVRFDKYARYVASGRTFANSLANASAVWRTIQQPVTEVHLMGEQPVQPDADAVDAVDDRYYSRDYSRNLSGIKAMNIFHNGWIKQRYLLSRFKDVPGVSSLMDVGVGKAGDLNKWISSSFTTVLGIDSVLDNLVNEEDGAYQRTCRALEKQQQADRGTKATPYTYAFVPLDARRSFTDQLASISDEYLRRLAQHMWGKRRDTSIPERYWELATRKFNVVSVQFAIHYFYSSPQVANTFVSNVQAHLLPGGYLVGTCFDGAQVDALFRRHDQDEVTGTKDDRLIWGIRKLYTMYDSQAFGQEISVYVETINQYIPEYLVDLQLLKSHLGSHGFRLLDAKECQWLGVAGPTSTGLFGAAFEELMADGSAEHDRLRQVASSMSPEERDFSFLNRWFIFKYDPSSPSTTKTTPVRRGRPPKKALTNSSAP